MFAGAGLWRRRTGFALGGVIGVAMMTAHGEALAASPKCAAPPVRELRSLMLTPGREFAANSYLYRDLSTDVPKDAHSELWIKSLLRQIGNHYGVVSVNIDSYAPPIFIADRENPTVRVGGRIEALGRNPGYFEPTPEGYKFGTTATGLAMLGGLITIAEQRAGIVDHAIHMALPETRRGHWAWPAQRSDGDEDDPDAIPQGATFRLPHELNLDQIDMDPYARMLARAVQKHGLVVRDTAGAVVLYAENPLACGAGDPYTGVGGILGWPGGRETEECYPDSNHRLRGFPWDRLEAVRATMQP